MSSFHRRTTEVNFILSVVRPLFMQYIQEFSIKQGVVGS